jgi:transposase
MSRLTTKDRKEQRWEAIRLDDHLIATGQVALRGGMLDNLIELTAEQLILRRSPIVRQVHNGEPPGCRPQHETGAAIRALEGRALPVAS